MLIYVLKTFTVLSRLFDHLGKPLDKKLRLIPKIMTSQTWEQIITVQILPNISRSKGNQAIKFGQLIKWDKQSYAKCGRKLFPDHDKNEQ